MSVMTDMDLRPTLGDVRDQSRRPTCLAFAASAAHEASRTSTDFLSTEFLFFAGAQRSHRNPKRGLSTTAVAEALRTDGQPVESAWPYQPDNPDAATWKCPVISVPYHRATVTFVPRTVTEIRGVLGAGTPVLLVVSVTLAMYAPDAEGIVRAGSSDRVTARKHALLAVGSGHGVEGGYILVRNSWGRHWGDQGHGWLHDAYLAGQLQTTGVIS
jgi:C1A family cysteine protease